MIFSAISLLEYMDFCITFFIFLTNLFRRRMASFLLLRNLKLIERLDACITVFLKNAVRLHYTFSEEI
jgi:hypothetical protein